MFFEMNDKYTGYEYLVTREPQENYNFYQVWIFQDHFTNTTSYIISNTAKNEID